MSNQALSSSVHPFPAPAAVSVSGALTLLRGGAADLQDVSWPQLSLVSQHSTVTARVERKNDTSAGHALLDAIDEVMSHRDPETIYRAAVHACREGLGLERVALFLMDESGEYLCGTWGTNMQGETTEEHQSFFQFESRHREAVARARAGEERFAIYHDVPLLSLEGSKTIAVTRGWNAVTPIFGRDRLIGLLVNDCAISGRSVDADQQMRVALFCRMLGGMLEDIRRGAEGLPWESVLTRAPFVARTGHERLVARVIRVLHEDPTASNQHVADRCGVSTSHVNQVFRKAIGLSLREYRNRLRVERFFTQVAPEGGNLMQAALEAGFGSYAQFHRVFREMLHSTPREHLSARARASRPAEPSVGMAQTA